MAQNKNALLRYRTIDRCLRNTGRRWTLDDLVDACSDALYEFEGRDENVSRRTVQLDIQMMRSDRLGYEAPIEVYDRKYYRYSDPDYSISNRPLSDHDIDVLNRTIDLLRQFDEFDRYHDMADVVNRLQDKVAEAERRRPIVDFERNPNLKGLELLNPLYDAIAARQTILVQYRSFKARRAHSFLVFPHMLKEYRNRWFLFCSRANNMTLLNLALDRMESFKIDPTTKYRDNPSFDDGYFRDIVGVTRYEGMPLEHVVLKVSHEQAGYLLTKPLHGSQTRTADGEGGSVTLEYDVIVNHEFVAQLMTFGAGVKVLAPASLADKMADIYRRALEQYTES